MNGPLSLFSNKTSSRFELLCDRRKGRGSLKSKNKALPTKLPGDHELDEQSFGSTARINPETASVHYNAAAETISGDSSPQVPSSTIRVKMELIVLSQA